MATSTFTVPTDGFRYVTPLGYTSEGIAYFLPGTKLGESWHYEFKTTGGKKLANVNVDDLFRVYPELAPTGYFGHYYDDEDRRKADQEFAKNILLAAEHNAGRKALKSLPKIKKNKEDK